MSGSGGSSYGGGFEATTSSCETLVINTQISSPKMDVVQGVDVGTVLDVGIESAGTISVVVLLHNGRTAGGVASPDLQRLRECIQSGTTYKAKVTSKNGPQVNIRIAVA